MRNHARAKRAAMINSHMRIQMRCLADRCHFPDKHKRITYPAFANDRIRFKSSIWANGCARCKPRWCIDECAWMHACGRWFVYAFSKILRNARKSGVRIGDDKKSQNAFELILAK